MPFLIPQKGDGLQVLAFKLANNSALLATNPMIPNRDNHLHDLMLIAAYNMANIGGGSSGTAAQVVTAPSSDSDFSMFPGGVAPSSGVYFAPRDNATIWSFAAGQTTWKIIATDVP